LSARLPAWAAGVFLVALAARLAFLFLADQPLLYAHQYTYFTNALRIAEHPEPLRYVLTSDEWRTWDQHWTIAPLYHLFAAAIFRLFGPHLLWLRLLQCVLDSLAAGAVGALARQVAGPRGWWAGLVYGLYWPAVEMPTWTMTENLHTVLLVTGVAVLAREAERPPSRNAFAGGILLGLSALARSVSALFIGLSVLWRLFRGGWRRSARSALLLAAGGAAVVLPWTARNVFVIGEPVLIETAAFENLWYANNFVDRERFRRQEQTVHGQPTPAAKRAAALHFALRGIKRHPGRFLEKVGINFRHFFRPEGLHNLLRIERSLEAWRHAGSVVLDDLVLVAVLPLFAVFLFGGRRSAAWALMLLWTAYYLLMVVVVFHNEIRYRSAFVPFAFAGAAGGWALLGQRASRRSWLVWLGLALGLSLSASMVVPFFGPAWRAFTAARTGRAARAAVIQGDLSKAEGLAAAAAAHNPRSPRPWMEHGKSLAFAGNAGAALDAYDRGAALATLANWRAVVARPRLLLEAGRLEEAAAAGRAVDRLSWDTDPWLILEIAWRELPAPRTDAIVLGQGDYGAVRGFLHPRGDPALSAHRLEWNRYERLGGPLPPPGTHRWSRRRAWLRLVPLQAAAAYDVTLEMGSPFPSPLTSPVVRVRALGSSWDFTLDREVKPYFFRVPATGGRALLVQIDSPTWNGAGEPAEQGVRVERFAVAPAH